MLKILSDKSYTKSELKELFTSVGWAMDLTEDQLYRAILNSTHYITVYDDEKLVGFCRSMDDSIYSANIDLVLVHKDYQGQGIASLMLQELLKQLAHIHYVSVSPNESKEVPLYLKNGFELMEDGKLLQIDNKKAAR